MLGYFTNKPVGPIIRIGISQPQGSTSPPVFPADTVWIDAIADTGATATCISASVAKQAGLQVIGKGNVTSATHEVAVNLYLGDLWIGGQGPNNSPFWWPFRDRTFHELTMSATTHSALLGMDIFKEGFLIVNGPQNLTTFAW